MHDRELDWIRRGSAGVGMTLATALPGGFIVYGVLDVDAEAEREQDLALLAALTGGAEEPLVAGVLVRSTHEEDEPGSDHELYSQWHYRFLRRHPADIRRRVEESQWPAWRLPEILYPQDRRWLVCTLWDDSWRSIGADEATADRVTAALPAFERIGRDVDLRTTGREPY